MLSHYLKSPATLSERLSNDLPAASVSESEQNGGLILQNVDAVLASREGNVELSNGTTWNVQ